MSVDVAPDPAEIVAARVALAMVRGKR